MAATTPGAAGVEIGDCLKLTIGVPTAARLAGGAAGEADAHRAFGIVGQVGHRCRIRHPKSGRHVWALSPASTTAIDESIGPIAAARVGEAITRSALSTPMHARSSGPVKRGLRPAVTAPRRAAARYSTTKSTFDGVASASTDPGRIPWSKSPVAASSGAIELGIGDRPAVFGDECLGVGEFDRARRAISVST